MTRVFLAFSSEHFNEQVGSMRLAPREVEKLDPREVEKLALYQAGFLAQKRLARGLRLNYTEAVALIATQILEFVRDGDKTVAELMSLGKQLLGRRQVLPAVPHLLDRVQVNGTFMDGTKLITIHYPIACDNGNLDLALRGSVFPVPSLDKFVVDVADCVPGKFICRCDEKIILNVGRKIVRLKVVNKADRPIQIGSHYHFIEVNPYLVFDRRKAYGMRLNIRAGTATRFEDALPLILFHLESGCTMPITKVPIFSQGIPNTSPLSALEVIKLLEVEMALWMALLIIPSLMK